MSRPRSNSTIRNRTASSNLPTTTPPRPRCCPVAGSPSPATSATSSPSGCQAPAAGRCDTARSRYGKTPPRRCGCRGTTVDVSYDHDHRRRNQPPPHSQGGTRSSARSSRVVCIPPQLGHRQLLSPGTAVPGWSESGRIATGNAVAALAIHRCASMGNRAIAETVMPAAPATTPSRAHNDAASSSATADLDVAIAPHTTAATPRMKPSPTTQNEATDSTPRATEAAGNRKPCCFGMPLPLPEAHQRRPVRGGVGDGGGHDPPRMS